MWIWISISVEHQLLLGLLALPSHIVVVLLTDLAFTVLAANAVWELAGSIFELVGFFAASAVHAFDLLASIDHTAGAFEDEGRIAVGADALLVPDAAFLDCLAD